MYRILMIAACGFLATAAQAETPAQGDQATAPAPEKAKKVCRIDEATTGSIMKRKTCRTQAEWDALGKANRLEMDTRQPMRGGGGTAIR